MMRSTYWAVTAYNAEIEILEKRIEVPAYIAQIVGGIERCPSTGKLHFQGMLQCKHQIRMSKLKKWLPTANLSVCRDKNALKKYVMKSETAVGEKTVWDNNVSGLHGFAISLMERVYTDIEKSYEEFTYLEYSEWERRSNAHGDGYPDFVCSTVYEWFRMRRGSRITFCDEYFCVARDRHLAEKPEDLYRFMNPPFRRLWCETFDTWFGIVHERRLRAGPAPCTLELEALPAGGAGAPLTD